MKKTLYVIIAAFMAIVPGISMAQTNSIFYHSIRAPQSLDENPSLYPASTTVFVTLPKVGLNFSSPLSLSDMLTHTPGDTATYIDLNSISNKLTDNNQLRLGLDADILGFGFKIGNTFATASVKLKTITSLGIPIDAINFLTKGNVDENGDPISSVSLLDGQLLNVQAYMETAIGGGHTFPDLGLTVGGKLKMYMGIGNISTANTHVNIETSDNMDEMAIKAYYELNVASIAAFDYAHPGDTVRTLNKNIGINDILSCSKGFGLDLGAKYKLGPVTLSASLLDLSQGIYWSQNTYKVKPKYGEQAFTFEGLDFQTSGLLNGEGMNFDTLTNLFKSQVDSLTNYDFIEGEGYWYSIPTKVNLGASISFLKICRAGLLIHGQWDRGLLTTKKAIDYDNQNFRFNTTLSASVNLKNWIELTVANGFVSDSKKFSIMNPGVGIILTPATAVQLFVMADYISSIYLVDAKAFNLQIGLNLIFGNGEAKKILKGQH
ncbi:MAG: DUF5723 family protein [Bacteroidales bacterium]|nr:DUF5723 family protein [Bacteroidales bacterium]